jgi:hypothetical protein
VIFSALNTYHHSFTWIRHHRSKLGSRHTIKTFHCYIFQNVTVSHMTSKDSNDRIMSCVYALTATLKILFHVSPQTSVYTWLCLASSTNEYCLFFAEATVTFVENRSHPVYRYSHSSHDLALVFYEEYFLVCIISFWGVAIVNKGQVGVLDI